MYGHLKKRWIPRYFKQFMQLKTGQDLAALLRIPLYKLELLIQHPVYNVFEVRKKGGKRLIEEPAEPLKKILKYLNNFLQSAYYYLKTDAAFGFVLTPLSDQYPRNILENAKRHLSQQYLVNIDLEDFFHQVKQTHIMETFNKLPFRFDKNLVRLIAGLTTYNKRLPMGSPTSPALSNFAMMGADNELLKFSRGNNLKFTRYVDDLSFSSELPITSEHFCMIEEILHCHQMPVNYNKVKSYGKDDTKIVTGLELGQSVKIPDIFLKEIDNDIRRLKHTLELNQKCCDRDSVQWTNKLKQALQGKINFVGLIYGYESPEYQKKMIRFEEAQKAEEMHESLSWLDFPYQF